MATRSSLVEGSSFRKPLSPISSHPYSAAVASSSGGCLVFNMCMTATYVEMPKGWRNKASISLRKRYDPETEFSGSQRSKESQITRDARRDRRDTSAETRPPPLSRTSRTSQPRMSKDDDVLPEKYQYLWTPKSEQTLQQFLGKVRVWPSHFQQSQAPLTCDALDSTNPRWYRMTAANLCVYLKSCCRVTRRCPPVILITRCAVAVGCEGR